MKIRVIILVIALIANCLLITSCSTDDHLDYQIELRRLDLGNKNQENEINIHIIDSVTSTPEDQNEISVTDLEISNFENQTEGNKTGGEDDDTVDPNKGEED